MKLAFSIATGVIWSTVALLEHTQLFPEPFSFSPLRSAFFAAVGIAGIVIATMHYAWQLWFARVVAALCVIFLALCYWIDLLPAEPLRIPTLVALVLWTMFAAATGYEKAPSLPGRVEYKV